MCSEIMNMSMLNQESVASGHFTIEKIKPAMEKFVNEQVGIFFHNDDKTE
ncbi:protein traM [Escherichia coli 2726800]|nr:protein traM [Escherichia coli DEC7C]EHV84741.1 protein traM [Escherichia coli DEC7D]EMW56858.1 protein traM [Escherichia coli 2762100]EMX69808.1 protein traM [Escherichia coli 2726800]